MVELHIEFLALWDDFPFISFHYVLKWYDFDCWWVVVLLPSGLTNYSCFALELSDFIPVDVDSGSSCRGDDALDDEPSYKEVSTVASLAECKELCRRNVACKGMGDGGWPEDGIEWIQIWGNWWSQLSTYYHLWNSGVVPQFPDIDLSSLSRGIEFSGSRCEVWTRAILAWIADSGSQCLKFLGWGCIGDIVLPRIFL